MPTIHLCDYLQPDFLVWDLAAADKAAVLAALARRVSALVPDIEEVTVLALLEEREAVQSTGIGGGLALPHAMVPDLPRPMLLVARLSPPVEYDALDDAPVDLLFLLLGAPEETRRHVRVLARLARVVGRADFLDQLRAAEDAAEAYRLLLEEDAGHV
jgi:PTS system nitrogen regulatory IIA component